MTDRNADMRHILAQVQLMTGGTVMVESATQTFTAEIERTLGVHMVVSEKSDGFILQDIERGDGAPGSGAQAMQRLCAYADKANKPIYLAVMGRNDRLITFYERFGFVVENEPSPNDDDDDMDANMMRPVGGRTNESAQAIGEMILGVDPTV